MFIVMNEFLLYFIINKIIQNLFLISSKSALEFYFLILNHKISIILNSNHLKSSHTSTF